MADQENSKNEELDNLDPILDEDSFSLDLDDFDLGDDDLESSPGLEPPTLEDVVSFEDDEESSFKDLVVSTSDEEDDDFLDIDLDSDLNLLGEEEPVFEDDIDIHNDFGNIEDTSSSTNKSPVMGHDDLELEFDDDIIDLDKEIEAILNGEDGILTKSNAKVNKLPETTSHSEFSIDDEDEEGPIALSMEELESITGGLLDGSGEEEEGLSKTPDDDLAEDVMLPEASELESELSEFKEEEDVFADEDSDFEFDLDDTEVDTEISFNEKGDPELVLDEDEGTEIPFTPIRDPEEEELFGSAKEDENLTLSDDELGNILGSNAESLEESLGGDLVDEAKEEDDDDGPISLSMDELENITDSEEPEINILDEELEDETITLSPDELGSIVSDEDAEGDEPGFDMFGDDDSELAEPDEEDEPSSGLEGEYEEKQETDSLDADEEGPLALSMEELESIAEGADEASDEDLMDTQDRAPLPYEEEQEKTENDFLEEDLEDESIALSMEELENITGVEEEEFVQSESDAEAISGDKIDDLLGEDLPGEGLADIGDLPLEEPKQATLGGDDSVAIDIDLDEYALEGKISALEELHASQSKIPDEKPLSTAAQEAIADADTELSKVDRKKVLGYLDNLLGSLPDDVIREFSKSQYFDLYKKLMKELEI